MMAVSKSAVSLGRNDYLACIFVGSSGTDHCVSVPRQVVQHSPTILKRNFAICIC